MSAADDAAVLVAMSVTDLANHLDGVDLETLNTALAAEQAKGDGARKGAIAALEAAIGGHPEQSAQAAAAANQSGDTSEPTSAPVTDQAAVDDTAPTDADAEPVAEPTAPVAETPASAETVTQPEADTGELRDAPTDADAVSAAPPRPHQSLVDALELRWEELKGFVFNLQGEVEGDLGDLLTFVRSKL